MSDQQAPSPEDKPAVAGPDGASGTAQEQPQGPEWFEQQYKALQPEYTRNQQRLSELEQQKQYYELALTATDPDTQRQALEALGYELPEEEEPEPAEYEDPYEQMRSELDELRQWRDQTTQSSQEAQQGELVRAITDERLSQIDGLAPEDQDMVLAYAINALPPVREPGVPVPLPDVKGAFEYFQARETERQKQWASTKKRAPYVSAGGRDATEAPVLGPNATHEQRVAFAAQKYQEMVGDE